MAGERKTRRSTTLHDTGLFESLSVDVDVQISHRREKVERDLEKVRKVFRDNLAVAKRFKIQEKLTAVSDILKEKFGYPVEPIALSGEPHIDSSSQAYPYVTGDGALEITLKWNYGPHTRECSIPVVVSNRNMISVRNGEGFGRSHDIDIRKFQTEEVMAELDRAMTRAFKRPVGTEDRYD